MNKKKKRMKMKENIIQNQSAHGTQNVHGTNSSILINRREAAEFLGVAESTLAFWKCVGRYNLKYIKIGRLVKYRISDLEEFIEQGINSD